MTDSWVVIENTKTGETYAVSVATFRKQYEPLGFVAIRHESGEPYEPPAPKKPAEKGEQQAPE